ncbi:hypothetical protein BJF79_02485 [Actinomadura sp. CNU-125]|nr:hypothetical protein BJF79_02485 [Actinomadura sp. CNU-125]
MQHGEARAPGTNGNVLFLGPALTVADIEPLSARLRDMMVSPGATEVVCDLGALHDPDINTLEVLARLQLAARRLGGSVVLRAPGTALRELLVLTGLDGVLPVEDP